MIQEKSDNQNLQIMAHVLKLFFVVHEITLAVG